MLIKLNIECLVKCEDFADRRLVGSSKLYESRGEQRMAKIRQDIVVGALAEFAVHKYITSDGRKCSKPDLVIYEKKNKSYSADLCSDEYKIHVKSQTADSADRWGLSWLFQKSDPVLRNPSGKDLLAFTKVDGLDVEVVALVSAKTLVDEHLIDAPRLLNYARTKRAVYYDELQASKINLFEL